MEAFKLAACCSVLELTTLGEVLHVEILDCEKLINFNLDGCIIRDPTDTEGFFKDAQGLFILFVLSIFLGDFYVDIH